jgi:GDP-4-dehydro-6-deoxy-D-mannose reductase
LSRKSALVTGASGFVGRRLTAALRESGWRVRTSDRHAPADLLGDLLTVPLKGLRVDVVFHLAGFANPSASVERPDEAFAGNAATTARICREVDAGRIVVASSCQVYGLLRGKAVETQAVLPRTPYAASKLCSEALALASGRDVVVLRPFNHTGPGQSDAYVCPWIARQIARAEAGLGPRVIELGATAPRLDFFDVRDMVRAYLAAASLARPGQVYNVATGSPVSIGEIVAILRRNARVPLRLRSKSGEPRTMSGDASKFRAATGWRPEIPLERTLRDLLEHERESIRTRRA